MRYNGAIWYPGADKHGYGNDDTHLKQGVAVHSAEGYASTMLAIIDDPSLEKSWTFSIMKNGAKYQHVDTENIQWTNGGYEANRRYWAIECEGRVGEALTDPQRASLIEVLRWMFATHGLTTYVRRVTLWEHNEFTQVYGYAYTACPSGRIPWGQIISSMEDDDMPLNDDDKNWINAAVSNQLASLRTAMSDATNDRRVIMRSPEFRMILQAAVAAELANIAEVDAQAIIDELAARLAAPPS